MIVDGVVQGDDGDERIEKDKTKSARRKISKDRRQRKEGRTKGIENQDVVREKLPDCKDAREASLASAKGKLVLRKKHAAEIFTEIDECKVIDGRLLISTLGSSFRAIIVLVRRGRKVLTDVLQQTWPL